MGVVYQNYKYKSKKNHAIQIRSYTVRYWKQQSGMPDLKTNKNYDRKQLDQNFWEGRA